MPKKQPTFDPSSVSLREALFGDRCRRAVTATMLTGRTRYRKTLLGSIVLQVEEVARIPARPGVTIEVPRWRDARWSDVMPVESVEVRGGRLVGEAV